MAIGPDTLAELADLGLDGKQLSSVLKIIARLAGAQDERRAKDALRKRVKRGAECPENVRGHSGECPEDSPRNRPDASRACVVIPLEGKKDTLPTHPSDATVPMPRKARKPVPDGWPEDAFDRWWAVYPRRVAKGDAEKAFVAAAKRGDTTFDGIMAATHRFARPPPDPQFTPYPATWLNGKRYLDEQAGPSLFERPRGGARAPTGPAAYLAAVDSLQADDGFGRGPVVDHWPPDRH